MGWPQVTWICLMVFTLTAAAIKHGQSKGTWHIGWSAVDAAALSGLLYAGGFFG